MEGSISHDRSEESPEAKARWFQTLTMQQRMTVFNGAYQLSLAMNPEIAKAKDDIPLRKGVQVFERE
jgi:hypothetical protein